MRILILGADGQVGKALAAIVPAAVGMGRDRLDIAAPAGVDWSAFDVVVNAAAFTDVEGAETRAGRAAAWRSNATGPARLAQLGVEHGFVLVHLSSDYVFDGRAAQPYPESAPFAPLNAYGATKAAGDLAVGIAPRHYLVRPSWVLGHRHDFVRTMVGLAARGVDPAVVADQVGRPTFAADVAAAIVVLLAGAPFGTYNVTAAGDPVSWADLARAAFALAGHDPGRIRDTTTAAYRAGHEHAAVRPAWTVLDLTKARRAGVVLPDWRDRLPGHVASLTGAR